MLFSSRPIFSFHLFDSPSSLSMIIMALVDLSYIMGLSLSDVKACRANLFSFMMVKLVFSYRDYDSMSSLNGALVSRKLVEHQGHILCELITSQKTLHLLKAFLWSNSSPSELASSANLIYPLFSRLKIIPGSLKPRIQVTIFDLLCKSYCQMSNIKIWIIAHHNFSSDSFLIYIL